MSVQMPSLDRVLLTLPSLIHLAKDGTESPRSWIQLARTGSFKSNRYGEFAITKDDLSTMLRNYTEVTPAAPTELPVDYDHLSMSPSKPGDGIAAGWFKGLELREDGDELWGLVEWTPEGATRIRNKEYRFVSPSFVKNHTHKDGTLIGPTLLAAAITNHPFLEGMAALTLYNFTAMGDLAVTETGRTRREQTMAKIGDKVSFIDDPIKVPELTPKEMKDTYVVKAVVDGTDGQFVRLETESGKEFGWFSTDQLAPAPAPKKTENPPVPMEPVVPTTPAEQVAQMSANTRLLDLSKSYAHTHQMSLSRAVIAVSAQYRELADTYLEESRTEESRTAVEPAPAVPPAQPLSLRRDADAGSQLLSLARTIAMERGISLSEATKLASRQRPEVAAAWERG